jgi:DNA-binding transcriptional ArsR family regulator
MASTQSELDTLIRSEPDLVDRIFDYILSDPAMAAAMRGMRNRDADPVNDLKAAVRAEFQGEECYIAGRRVQAAEVLAQFNGRNASEVARRLDISRATVYRHIKQPGKSSVPVKKQSQISGK